MVPERPSDDAFTAASQRYEPEPSDGAVFELELIEGPQGWGLREKPRSAKITSPLLRMLGRWAMYAKTRDFINLAALFLTFVNAYWIIYLGMLVGGIATAMIVIPDHIRLRLQLREIARRGGRPHLVTS